MQNYILKNLLLSLFIVIMMNGVSVSKSRYDIFRKQFKEEFKLRHGRDPHLKIDFVSDSTSLINEDYEIYIDSMRQVLQDIEIKGESRLDLKLYSDASLNSCSGIRIVGGVKGEFDLL